MVAGAAIICVSWQTDAAGQTLQQRIDHVRQRQASAERERPQAQSAEPSVASKLSHIVDRAYIEGASARQAFEWWSRTTGIPLVIHWDGLLLEGIDPETQISVNLQNIPAAQVLAVLMQQTSPEQPLLYELTPWYVQVMTKRQANANPIVRVYEVRDLLMLTPSFENPYPFSLSEITANRQSDGQRSSNSLFDDDDDRDRDRPPSLQQRGDELAQLIRDTIEPDIWREHGGEHASIRYHNGRLIVRAPLYVHRQIGAPVVISPRPRVNPAATQHTSSDSADGRSTTNRQPVRNNVSGASQPSRPVSGVR